MKKHAIVIGAGFAGLGMAALLGKEGWQVTLLEKNASAGGRARLWQQDGYSFDMGPSWYLMPEVFETFFQLCGEKREDYYSLTKLDPYYRIFWGTQEFTDIRADRNQIDAVFNQLEAGGARKLQSYLAQAEFKYRIALEQFLYREYRTIFDFFNSTTILKGLKLNIFKDLDRYVSTFFSNPKSKKILEYAMVFLGNSPDNAPALYSLLSHVDLNLGVWFPARGMIAIVKGLEQLCRKFGVEIHYNREVKELVVENKLITRVLTAGQEYRAGLVISSADLHHTETVLLAAPHRSYPEKYWSRKVIAPSMFIMYLGIKKTLPSILHHNLYFAPDWYQHFAQIFKKPAWPREPCYYVSCTSKTDKSVAPPGCENLFILVPVAPGLEDTPEIRQQMADRVLSHCEQITGEQIRPYLSLQRIFSVNDFQADYNAYKGTALGLAHTLRQTAVFRPQHRSRKLRNLFYTSQYNHPGVGVPMVLISDTILYGILKGIYQ